MFYKVLLKGYSELPYGTLLQPIDVSFMDSDINKHKEFLKEIVMTLDRIEEELTATESSF